MAAFSDVDYQRRVWVDGIMPFEGYEDSLTENIHALYDDFLDLPQVDDAIGEILLDGPEVEALVAFDRAFRPILDELGDAPDIDYLAHPSWGVVVQRAQRALSAMVLANPGSAVAPQPAAEPEGQTPRLRRRIGGAVVEPDGIGERHECPRPCSDVV